MDVDHAVVGDLLEGPDLPVEADPLDVAHHVEEEDHHGPSCLGAS